MRKLGRGGGESLVGVEEKARWRRKIGRGGGERE